MSFLKLFQFQGIHTNCESVKTSDYYVVDLENIKRFRWLFIAILVHIKRDKSLFELDK